MVHGSGFRVQGVGFMAQSSGVRAHGSGLHCFRFGFMTLGFRFRAKGRESRDGRLTRRSCAAGIPRLACSTVPPLQGKGSMKYEIKTSVQGLGFKLTEVQDLRYTCRMCGQDSAVRGRGHGIRGVQCRLEGLCVSSRVCGLGFTDSGTRFEVVDSTFRILG